MAHTALGRLGSVAVGNDSIVIRLMTILGLSWDHAALDGAVGQFLERFRRELERLAVP